MLDAISKRIIVFLGCGFAAWLLFVIYFTWTYDPIGTYSFHSTAIELGRKITGYIETQPNLSYRYTDTVGTHPNDLAYYMEIRIKSGDKEYEYNIRYENAKSLWKKSPNSEMKLISAFGDNHKIGGYQRDDNGVEKLVVLFEESVAKQINITKPE